MIRRVVTTIILLTAFVQVTQAQTTYKSQARNSSSTNNRFTGERDYSQFSVHNIIYSGNLSFNFYSDIFSFGGGPIVGYKFNDYLSAGVRVGYNYYKWKDYNSFYNADDEIVWKPLRNDYYQTGIWTRISPIDMLYAHVEFEHHRIVQKTYVYDHVDYFKKHKERFSINSLMVGLGYKQMISDRFSYCYTVLYDVLQNTSKNTITDPSTGRTISLSPYANTIDIRFGIYYNF